ncbi:hypothetical protein [Piscirickettsia salmonis]|uniref:hypothetical protein n=1 Tax=Piscirickettsia salmonis TaxID=1238 RepID=UPI0007C94514|nr:hypothetical protein A0O36_02044 [Piscirickettsiaceae bacterium NZ-RLO1]
MPLSKYEINYSDITFDTDSHEVTKSAHTVKKGRSKSNTETYFYKEFQSKSHCYDSIASLLAEKWYKKFALVSETRIVMDSEDYSRPIGSASVGLQGFIETQRILDTLTDGNKKLELAFADSDGSSSSKFKSDLNEFFNKYQSLIKALQNPSSTIPNKQYADFCNDFDKIFTKKTSVIIDKKNITLKELAYGLVSGKAGADIALMLYPDGDNHQCNNGVSINQAGQLQYSKIDHDYSSARLQKHKPPDELKCKMNEAIVAALTHGNPVPLQMTRRFDSAKPENIFLRFAHSFRRKKGGSKTTTSEKDAFWTRAIQLRHRELYQAETEQALLKAIALNPLTPAENKQHYNFNLDLLKEEYGPLSDQAAHLTATPTKSRRDFKRLKEYNNALRAESESILERYQGFLLKNQQQLYSILKKLNFKSNLDDYLYLNQLDLGQDQTLQIIERPDFIKTIARLNLHKEYTQKALHNPELFKTIIKLNLNKTHTQKALGNPDLLEKIISLSLNRKCTLEALDNSQQFIQNYQDLSKLHHVYNSIVEGIKSNRFQARGLVAGSIITFQGELKAVPTKIARIWDSMTDEYGDFKLVDNTKPVLANAQAAAANATSLNHRGSAFAGMFFNSRQRSQNQEIYAEISQMLCQ